MIVKKSAGRILGAQLTNKEQKAMEIEICKCMAEYDRKNEMEVDALVLWHLRTQLGFGEERLKRFFLNFVPAYKKLVDRYELGPGEHLWLYTKMLKDDGIDIEEWYKEIKE